MGRKDQLVEGLRRMACSPHVRARSTSPAQPIAAAPSISTVLQDGLSAMAFSKATKAAGPSRSTIAMTNAANPRAVASSGPWVIAAWAWCTAAALVRASLRINEPAASEQHFETQGKEGMGEAVIGLKGERALQ